MPIIIIAQIKDYDEINSTARLMIFSTVFTGKDKLDRDETIK